MMRRQRRIIVDNHNMIVTFRLGMELKQGHLTPTSICNVVSFEDNSGGKSPANTAGIIVIVRSHTEVLARDRGSGHRGPVGCRP
jgi:hypothetical protein